MLPRGAQVAGYEVGDVLGRGGMAVVYEARELATEREVALKVFTAANGMDPSFRQRFEREGRIQATVDHPSIATVYEAGEWEDALFIAMRLVRGPTLKDLTIAGGLESERLLRILTPVAAALDAAHAAGLIHRDVKPQNILIGEGERAFLADFGLTKGHGDTALTRAGEFVGTIDYCAPEQIMGQPATAAADVYSLGAVFYECLTGTVPFPRDTDPAVMYAHLSEPAPWASEERPDLPLAIDQVVGRALAKDPAERQPSAGALMAEAAQVLGD